MAAGSVDELLGNLHKSNRFAHVQDEHLAGLSDRARLDHQLARLLNSHEETGSPVVSVGVIGRVGVGTPLGDLEAELAEYDVLHDATLIEATGIEQLPTALIRAS